MMNFKKWYLVPLIVILAACSSTTPTVAPTDQPVGQNTLPADASSDYPVQAPAAQQDPGYPAPTNSNIVPSSNTVLPTVDPQLGQVKGVLLEAGAPVTYINLYLAELLKSDKGENVAYAFVRDEAPSALTNERGEFAFVNVPVNTYALIYDLATKSVLLLDPEDDTQIKLVIEAGTSIDLGTLDYQALPTD